MKQKTKKIRNSAKAIIIRNGKLLAIQKSDEHGPWYLLPGGGQHPEETLHKALKRECREEINADIEIGNLRFIREYISKNHEFAETDRISHQIEFMFECKTAGRYKISTGKKPDTGQEAVKWLSLNKLMNYRLYPLSLRRYLMKLKSTAAPVYLGDVN